MSSVRIPEGPAVFSAPSPKKIRIVLKKKIIPECPIQQEKRKKMLKELQRVRQVIDPLIIKMNRMYWEKEGFGLTCMLHVKIDNDLFEEWISPHSARDTKHLKLKIKHARVETEYIERQKKDAHAEALLLHYAGLDDEDAHTDPSTQHLSNQEQLRKYRSQYKTKITEETKLKVGDIVYRLSEDVFMVTSVTKCFITMKYMRPSAPPIFTCEGSIVGCVDYVFKIDTSVLPDPDTKPRRISIKTMIEYEGYSVSTDLENIYSITSRDWLS